MTGRFGVTLLIIAQRFLSSLSSLLIIVRPARSFRLLHFVVSAILFARLPVHCFVLGWREGFRFWKHALWGKRIVEIQVSGFPKAIAIRPKSSDSFVFDAVFVHQCYKDARECSSPRWILDAGGYAGYSAIYFSHLFPDCKIVCVEPEIGNYDLMTYNISGNDRIIPVNKALWSHDGQLGIALPDNHTKEDSWGYQVDEKPRGAGMTARGITLKILQEEFHIPAFDILKIDIEGAEKEICDAHFAALFANCQMMFIETHEHVSRGSSVPVRSLLETIPCTVSVVGGNLLALPEKRGVYP